MNLKIFQTLGVASLLSLSLLGCGTAGDGDLIEEGALSIATGDDKADGPAIAFTEFTDDIGTRGQSETRRVFTSAASYKSYFGHAAPATVAFPKEWVVFYSAGVKNTGGYDAKVAKITTSTSGLTLKVVTSLVSPGSDCFVTQALTKPYALVKLKRPNPTPSNVSYFRDDSVRSCSAPSCDTVRCAAGTHCELVQVFCITTPCNPQPQCVADTTCPGAGSVSSSTGQCECLALGLCIEPLIWNSDPAVCGCETVTSDPCATVRCAAGTHCVASGNAASCVPDAPAGGCTSVADCYEYDDYCGGCNCRAFSVHDSVPACTTTIVNCFAAPCQVNSGTLACINNKCTFR